MRGFDKERAREQLRTKVLEHLDAMTEAQIASAKGINYLVSRDKKSGKFKVLSAEDAKKLLDGEQSEVEVIEVWKERPNTPAFTDLLNRTIDKPAEQVDVS